MKIYMVSLLHRATINYHLVAAELPFVPKLIDCMHQTIKIYLQKEHSILLSVIAHPMFTKSVTVSVAV